MNSLRGSYALLCLLCLASFLTFILIPPNVEGWRGFALNLGTELIGLLLTVFLIDRVLRRREERERDRYRSVAVQQLRFPLMHHFQFLFDIHKATVERRPQHEITRPEELFDEHYGEYFLLLDLRRPAPISPPMSWDRFVVLRTQEFKEELGRVVDKYSMHLDPDTIDVMEQLINSDFVRIAEHLPMVVADRVRRGDQGPVTYGGGIEDLVNEHARTFCRLLGMYNDCAPSDRQLLTPAMMWRDDQSPAIGSARIAIPSHAPEETPDPNPNEA